MTDNDKPVADTKPTKEPKAKEPKAKEPKAQEPKTEESAGSQTAPADDAAAPARNDPYGRQLYNVNCAACGKQAQVPFKPSGDRPVYCRDCYMKQRGGGRG